MTSPPPIISNHRLARLALWLLAMLAWFALGGNGNTRQRRRIEINFDKIARAVRNIIILRAAQLMPQRRAKVRYGPHRPPRARLRAIAGVWLRRRLRTRGDLIARAMQLLAVLRHWRELGAALARRRIAGLSRLARIWFTCDRAAFLSPPAVRFARIADTS